MNITFVIEGEPISKARHRSTRQGRMYSAQTKIEAATKWQMQQQLPDEFKILDGPLSCRVAAHFQRPKSHWGTGRNAGVLKKSAPEFCLNSKDVDNVGKIFLDCMSGLIYKDDRQITELRCTKTWVNGEDRFGRISGFTVIEVETIDE